MWPDVTEISRPTFWNAIEGRGKATNVTLTALARVAAIVNFPRLVVSHELPTVPRELLIADLERLRKLAKSSPFIRAWVDKRLQQVQPALTAEPEAVRVLLHGWEEGRKAHHGKRVQQGVAPPPRRPAALVASRTTSGAQPCGISSGPECHAASR